MKQFSIHLLGPLKIYFKEKPIKNDSPFQKLFLFYLAFRECLISREELKSVFANRTAVSSNWIDEVLSKLRENLPDSGLIISVDEFVGLDFEQIDLDLNKFYDVIDRVGEIPWKTPRNHKLPQRTVKLLNQAVALWSGKRFWEEIDFLGESQIENEIQETRRELAQLRLDILERLAEHNYITGDFDSAQLLLQKALSEDKTSDRLHYLQMQILIDRGETTQAREYYRKVTKVMLAHGRVSPAPNLIALYREIQRGVTVEIPEPQPTWNIHPGVKMPLVGRENVISDLNLSRKQQKSVFLFGDVGQGKTRVLEEYAEKVSPRMDIFYVACKPSETSIAYQPFISLLRHQITPDNWLELSPVWAGPLSRLLPEITMIRPNAEEDVAPAEDDQSASLIMESIRQVLKLLASKRSLLLIFDDIQYADKSTLQILTYLMERYPFKDGRGMIIVTARESELKTQHPGLVDSVSASKHINLIRLQNLSLNDISKLAYYFLQESPSQQLTRTLAKESGGNPLFIAEILWAILDSEAKLNLDTESGLPISEKLSNIIDSRLSNLDVETYAALETAAVLGLSFELSLLPLMEERSIQVIEEAIKENIIVQQNENQNGLIKYRFSQKKVREVLLQRMHPARSVKLHKQAARIKVDEEAEPAIIADHYEKANIFEAAFYYWVKAGERARHLASSSEVTTAFQRAEKLRTKHNLSPSPVTLYNFFTTWSAVAFETQEIKLLKRLNQTLLEIGEKQKNDLLLGTAWGNLANACMALGQFEEGLINIDQALSYLNEKCHPTEYIENLLRRGVFLYMLNRLDQAEDVFQDALTLGSDTIGDPKMHSALANAHYQIALTNTLNAHPKIGLKHAKLSLVRAKEANHPHRQMNGYAMIAFSHYYLGEYEKSRLAVKNGLELATRVQGWRMQGYLHAYCAMIELADGNISDALENAYKVTQLGQRFAYPDVIALGNRTKGDIYYLLQAHTIAEEQYSKGYQAAQEHFTGFDNYFRKGITLAQEGKINKGQELLEEALEQFETASVKTGVVSAMLALEVVSFKKDDLDRAMMLNTRVRNIVNGNGLRSLSLVNQIIAGKMALKTGNTNQAEEYFQRVSQEAFEISNPWIELEAQRGLFEVFTVTEQENDAPERRITELLEGITDGITHKHILPYYTTFQERILTQKANAVLHF